MTKINLRIEIDEFVVACLVGLATGVVSAAGDGE